MQRYRVMFSFKLCCFCRYNRSIITIFDRFLAVWGAKFYGCKPFERRSAPTPAPFMDGARAIDGQHAWLGCDA